MSSEENELTCKTIPNNDTKSSICMSPTVLQNDALHFNTTISKLENVDSTIGSPPAKYQIGEALFMVGKNGR